MTNFSFRFIIVVMKEKVQKIIESKFGRMCDKYCNSVWYIITMGIVCVFAHSLNLPVLGTFLLTVLLVPALLFCDNSFVLVPFMLICSFVLSEEKHPQTGYFNTPFFITVLVLCLVIAVAALVFNIVYYKKWKTMFKRAYFSVSFAALTAALLLAGVGAPTWTFSGFGIALSIIATMFFPYALLVNCGKYEGQKTVEYFAYAVLVAAAAVAAGFFKQFVVHDFDMNLWTVKDYLKLGYVGPNTGAAIITLAIPMTFYLVCAKKRGYLWLIAVAVELLFVVLSFSRASLVVAVPGVIIVSTVLCFKKKTERKGYWISYGIAVAIAVVLCIVFRDVLIGQLKILFEGNVTGSGRTVLWKDGFEAWKSYPIAGVGFWYLRTTGHWYFSFHCTPLTYLYCAGVLGLLAYLYHRFMTVRAVFGAKLTKERVFVALTMLAMLCNALLDIAMTSATHLMYYSVMLALIDLDLNFVKTSAVRRDGPVVATDDMDRTEEKTDNNSASDNTINQDGEQNEL